MVLESDEGEGETGVAAEPELEGDEHCLGNGGGTRGDSLGGGGTVHHQFVAIPMTSGLGKLVPDVEPISVMLINTLTANFHLNGLNELVAGPLGETRRGDGVGDGGLEVDSVDKITISGDGAGDLLTEVGETVEGLLNGLHGEVGVSAVDHLEESNLGVTGQVNVLGTVSYKLHKTSTHYVF
ncbi:hypothetical protein QKU58_gp021 [Pyramimonas orientalis virus]|uniref:Uncharacterized protein n=1 Tax=Pyramimonas orientalis virus 01B TaxID=3134525 RepID=A0A7L9AXA8_9VIRU|nr:hypothetical protein QKU58_gp021 [Pyramimonas orientalis virus]QOI90159.1 hypothetical protein HWQ62_00021 [Pyramimonas orientalis virus]